MAKNKSPRKELSRDEKMLVQLREELYDGSWEKMLNDLKNRLSGKPYIFKLVTRIQEDIGKIEKLWDYEKKNKVNLANFIKDEEE